LAIGTEESLPGGVMPEFVVDVSSAGASYARDGARSSVDELTAAFGAAATYRPHIAATFLGIALAAWLALVIQPWLLIVVVIVGIALLARASSESKRRRRVAVRYRLDPAAGLAFDSITNGVSWLAGSAAVWRVTHEEALVRPANTTSVTRAAASIRCESEIANVLTNITVPSIAAAGETLLFFPEGLVIRDGSSRFIDVPYSKIRVELDSMRFSETGEMPRDARQVGNAWLYANKDGSPDRRRANNRDLPVLDYARVTLTWRDSGCVLLVSNNEAARRFVNALARLAQAPPKPAPPKPAPLKLAPVVELPPARIAAVVTPPAPPPPPAPTVAVPRVGVSAAPRAAALTISIETASEVVNVPVPAAAPTELERALQASIDRKRRLAELERQALSVVRDELAVSRSRSGPQAPGEWLAEGRSATVHGLTTGHFVYVGNRLPSLSGSGVEPSLINPALPVDPSHANTTGAGMNYWPSYDRISAASRRAFLQWLAGGRSDPNAYIGYAFIFFYGLERRVYEFVQGRGSHADEVLAIGREVARLIGLYGTQSGSFRSYATSFLDLIASVEPRARELNRTRGAEFGPSQSLRIALGELSLAGKPVPADYALEWIRSSWSLNTPALRCAGEFELLFHIRYAKQYGEGMIVKPNKSYVDLSYRPASGTLEPITLKKRQIPDVTQLVRPLEKLVALAQECSNALDAFSRFLGKNPEGRESLAAFALLPDELVEATPSADATALASLVQSRMDDSGRVHLSAGEILQYVRVSRPDKISKSEALLLAQALEKLGYAIEPDVRLGGPVYDADGPVVVFRRLPDCPSTASDEYETATLCMRLGAIVSASDDEVSEHERSLLQKHIAATLQLSPGERQRLAAHLAWLLEAKPGTSGLRKRLAALSTSARHHVGQLLITVATSDGRVDPREMKILEKLYGLIGLETSDLYADIHAALATDDEPIAVEQAPAKSKGFAIPPKPAPATTASGIDMERVRLKIAETREVSTLLSSIFVEEEAPAVSAPPVKEGGTIGTLDAAHSELLRRLGERESWPRDEVERLAAELALLPDGALETINDYAYAAAAEPLWEDEDPVAINRQVAMELIA
jgi:uncharacterized tellurite resistance protein B-like protein